ncbi:MAG: flavodoxin family protein [Candidatus Ozemobacteraceae bacterium]
MKFLMINGSHRIAGNTETFLSVMKTEFEKYEAATESVLLATLSLEHCRVCDSCKGTSVCIIEDGFNPLLKKILEADVLVIGTPVYVGMPSSRMTVLLQRLAYLALSNGNILKNKIGVGVVVAGETGHLATLNSIVDFFLVNEMTILGSRYWPIGTATKRGEIHNDVSAIENLKYLAKKVVQFKSGGPQ